MKKIISLFLIICMFCSMFALPSYALTEDERENILSAKPTEYVELAYNIDALLSEAHFTEEEEANNVYDVYAGKHNGSAIDRFNYIVADKLDENSVTLSEDAAKETKDIKYTSPVTGVSYKIVNVPTGANNGAYNIVSSTSKATDKIPDIDLSDVKIVDKLSLLMTHRDNSVADVSVTKIIISGTDANGDALQKTAYLIGAPNIINQDAPGSKDIYRVSESALASQEDGSVTASVLANLVENVEGYVLNDVQLVGNENTIIMGKAITFGQYSGRFTLAKSLVDNIANEYVIDLKSMGFETVSALAVKDNAHTTDCGKVVVDNRSDKFAKKMGSNGISVSTITYVPVTLENAEEGYYYFVRVGNAYARGKAIHALTAFNEETLKSKIDAINAEIETLNKTDAEIIKAIETIKVKIAELIAENDGVVLESDFNTDKLNNILDEIKQEKIQNVENRIDAIKNAETPYSTEVVDEIIAIINLIEQLKAEGINVEEYDTNLIENIYDMYEESKEIAKQKQIDAIETEIRNLPTVYSVEIKEMLLNVKTLIEAFGESELIDVELMEKFNDLYAVYNSAERLKDRIAALDNEYEFTDYDGIVAIKNELSILGENTVDSGIVQKFNEKYNFAISAKQIDERFLALGEYSKEEADEVLLIYNDMTKLTDNTAAFEYYSSIINYYKVARKDMFEASVEELDEVYVASNKDKILSLQEEYENLKKDGVEVSEEVKSKLENLIAQMNEVNYYIPIKLRYTRDAFESSSKYTEQAVKDGANYIFPEDAWNIIVSLRKSTTTAFDEDSFIDLLKPDENNNLAINEIPYSFGKFASDVHGVSNEANIISSIDTGEKISIDVPLGMYSSFKLVAFSGWTDNVASTITYVYTDGTTSVDENVKVLRGARSNASVYEDEEYVANLLGNKTIKMFRPQSKSTESAGAYNAALPVYTLTPDAKKVLKKIEITTGTEVSVFALTGVSAQSMILGNALDKIVAQLDDEKITDAQIREMIKTADNIIAALENKETSVNGAYKEKIVELKREYIDVESVECYTDLNYRKFTVKFTGPIKTESITEEMFKVTKNGEKITDYEVNLKNDNTTVEVLIANKYDYSNTYNLEMNESIEGEISGKLLATTNNKEYDGKNAIDVIVEDSKVKLTNNMAESQSVTAVMAVYNLKNRLISRQIVTKELAPGEMFEEAVTANVNSGEKVMCIILDSIDNSRRIYEVINVK